MPIVCVAAQLTLSNKWCKFFHCNIKYKQSPTEENYARSITCICMQMHQVIFGRGNEEEPSFNGCSLTYCVFLRNSLILDIVIVGVIQGCQGIERSWLAHTFYHSGLCSQAFHSAFSFAFSLDTQETRGAIPSFKLII